MSWEYSSGRACHTGITTGDALVQEDVFIVGQFYLVKITVESMTRGKLTFPTLSGGYTILEDGTYEFFGTALYKDLSIVAGFYAGNLFNGCVDLIEVRAVPIYSIKTSADDTVVFTLSDTSSVTASGQYVQYQIDWSTLDEGCYYIEFEDSTLTYKSDCFTVKLTHPCTLQLTWNCNENAFGFNYSDLSFTQSLRVDAKLWKSRWKALDKQVYEYSTGDLEILYVTKTKEYLLTIKEIPEYMIDAVSLAIDSDNFFIDGIEYVFPDEELTPTWRNSSDLAPVEVTVRKSQNLRNVNCG